MPTAVTAISATRLATIMAGVQERVEEHKLSESERLKRINDEKAAKKAALQVRTADRSSPGLPSHLKNSDILEIISICEHLLA